MTVLWDRQEATVADVIAGLRSTPKVSYNTVQTLLRILETKGYVRHDKSGRAFLYHPIVDAPQARRRALRHLMSRLFNGSASLLVLNMLEDEQVDRSEIEQLKRFIADA